MGVQGSRIFDVYQRIHTVVEQASTPTAEPPGALSRGVSAASRYTGAALPAAAVNSGGSDRLDSRCATLARRACGPYRYLNII
jgi:hypothetical protein